MDEKIHGRKDKWIKNSVDAKMNGWNYERMKRAMLKRLMDAKMNGWKYEKMKGGMNEETNGWKDELIKRWINESDFRGFFTPTFSYVF